MSKIVCCLLTNTDTHNINIDYDVLQSLSLSIFNHLLFISLIYFFKYSCMLLLTCENEFQFKGCKEEHPCSSYVPSSLSRTTQNFCTQGRRCWKLSGHYRSVFIVPTFIWKKNLEFQSEKSSKIMIIANIKHHWHETNSCQVPFLANALLRHCFINT